MNNFKSVTGVMGIISNHNRSLENTFSGINRGHENNFKIIAGVMRIISRA